MEAVRYRGEPTPDDLAERCLLRFITCGSVDDGKSTLIGRLLHDANLISEDHLAAVHADSLKHGTAGNDADLALLLDGLEAEREQGITIDVAYRYFATARRAFIVADTPGHEQYTRNMATGASTAGAAVLLVDARKGALTQTQRHSHICALFGIRAIVIAVNKIDLVDFSQDRFGEIVADYTAFADRLGFRTIVPIPLSARFGDNVVHRAERMPWYEGPTLLEALEVIDVDASNAAQALRFPVQWINRPNADFRGYAGTIASGDISVGDPLVAACAGRQTRVARIVTFDGDLASAAAGDAVTLVLEDEIDVGRGELLAPPDSRPEVADQFATHLLWFDDEPMLPGRSYLMRIGTRMLPAQITALKYKVDPATLEQRPARTLALNEIGFCNLSTASPVAFDPYAENRRTGAFILIDRQTNATAGAGMIAFGLRRAGNIHRQSHAIDKPARAALMHQNPCVLWFTGLPGAGKSTVANLVERLLHERGIHTMLLDGDDVRLGLNRDLGFTNADRVENVRRVGEVAKLFVESGLVVLACFVSPFRAERDMVRESLGAGEFVEIFVDAPLDECVRRDPKGLYAKAKAGTVKNVTGIDSPYEAPQAPDLHLHTELESAEDAAEHVIEKVIGMISI